MRAIGGIMVHHSLTADQTVVDWGAIEDFHRSWRKHGTIITAAEAAELRAAQGATKVPGLVSPWSDIGYHRGVERINGRVHTLVGRPEWRAAAACPQGNMNRVALHVCCVGNFDNAAPSGAMLEELIRRTLVPWCRRYQLEADDIVGHRDHNPHKSCPGTAFDLEELRELVERAL